MSGPDTLHEHHRWHFTWMGSDRLLARNLARPVARFIRIEAASGILLILGALVAMIWANTGAAESYHHLLETELGVEIGSWSLVLPLHDWINDAAMTVFFFVVGMEIKREMVHGELRDPKAAAMPVLAAVGGMLVPALIYLAFNAGTDASRGWGIPMATDIAFAVGVVSLLGSKVPVQLKLFLLTLAVADDLGAIAVIAVAYSSGLEFAWLGGAVAVLALVYLLRRAQVWYFGVYIVLGAVAWYCMFRSGVHATVAGVVLGFLTPTRPLNPDLDAEAIADELENQPELTAADVRNHAFRIREAVPVDERLIDALHPWSSYVILPIFAFANAGVTLSADALGEAVTSPITLGVLLGLVVGKTVGVFGFSFLAAKLGVGKLPRGASMLHMLGISMAAGIGFTVAIFVTGLALVDPVHQDFAKIGIFGASFIAAILATIVLSAASRRVTPDERAREEAEEAELFAEEDGQPAPAPAG